MNLRSITEIDSTKAKFIALFATTLVLCVAVSAAFWGPFSGFSSSRQIAEGDPDEIVATRQTFPSGRRARTEELPGADSAVNREQLNASMVSNAEKSLRASMDSIHGKGYAENNTQVNHTLSLFREAIKNPQSMSVINDVLNNRHKAEKSNGVELAKLKDELLIREGQLVALQNQLKTAQNTASTSTEVARLKKELQTKDAQITGLQNQLKAAPKEAANNPQALAKMKNDLMAKDAQIARLTNQLKARPDNTASNSSNSGLVQENKKLQQENNFLKWAVRSEVSSNHNLSNLNSSLKQANANLQNQVNELKKAGGGK